MRTDSSCAISKRPCALLPAYRSVLSPSSPIVSVHVGALDVGSGKAGTVPLLITAPPGFSTEPGATRLYCRSPTPAPLRLRPVTASVTGWFVQPPVYGLPSDVATMLVRGGCDPRSSW